MGRSGLVVNPLALGTMTFGTVRWGSGDDVPKGVFNAYEDAGGNFVDTANVYLGGKSEEMLGGYIAGRHLRDQVVLATKLGFEVSDGEKFTGKLNGRPEYGPNMPASPSNARCATWAPITSTSTTCTASTRNPHRR